MGIADDHDQADALEAECCHLLHTLRRPLPVPDGVWITERHVLTETEVRADEGGWTRAPLGKKEAFRSEIRSIRYVPKRYTFYGADGQALMAISNTWTMPDMVKAAEVLRVPLYDDRTGRAKGNGVNRGRLVYDPGSGPDAGR
jgi:hypothetical protein